MLVFLLFMAYKSSVTTGVNLLATIIYQGPVSRPCHLLLWISRESKGLLLSVVLRTGFLPRTVSGGRRARSMLTKGAGEELGDPVGPRPRLCRGVFWPLLEMGSGRPRALIPA